MSGKEFVNSIITSYFMLVTLITVAMLILGSVFETGESFGYEVFAYPLIYGVCGAISQGIMYSKKELTIKEVIIRKVIQLIFLEIVIPTVAFGGSDVLRTQPQVVVGMVISILVIFVLTHIIDWVLDSLSAKKMTEDLVRFQQSVR